MTPNDARYQLVNFLEQFRERSRDYNNCDIDDEDLLDWINRMIVFFQENEQEYRRAFKNEKTQ